MSRFVVLLFALLLSACGLKPLYSGGSQGAAGQLLGAVEVSAIPGKAGWLMRDSLLRRFGPLLLLLRMQKVQIALLLRFTIAGNKACF